MQHENKPPPTLAALQSVLSSAYAERVRAVEGIKSEDRAVRQAAWSIEHRAFRDVEIIEAAIARQFGATAAWSATVTAMVTTGFFQAMTALFGEVTT